MSCLTSNINTQIDFYSDSTCTGCGNCEKVCLSTKIRIQEGQPLWLKDVNCYYCYACFNSCPTQSILVRNKYTQKEGRYLHPDVTTEEISWQKCLGGHEDARVEKE